MRIFTFAILITLVGCDDHFAINLDGEPICPPAQAVLGVPWWLKSVKGLDSSYAEVRLSIGQHRVLVVNDSAISSLSAMQEDLLKAAGSGNAKFEPIKGTTFFMIANRSEFPDFGWEVVRWLPKGSEGASPHRLAQWIVGHCSLVNNQQSCLIQRIDNGLAYEFYYHGSMSQLDQTTMMIDKQLTQWRSNCRAAPTRPTPGT